MKKLLFAIVTLLTALNAGAVAAQQYTDSTALPPSFSFEAIRFDYRLVDNDTVLVHTQSGITVNWNRRAYSSFSGSYGSLTITNFYSNDCVTGQADITFNNRSNKNFQWDATNNCIYFSFPAFYYSSKPNSEYSYAVKYNSHKYAFLGLATRKVTANGSSDWITGESTYYGWGGGTVECCLNLNTKTIEINHLWGCFMMSSTQANNSTVLEVFDKSVFEVKPPTTLAWIEENGEVNTSYTVADQLVGVYAQDGSLWCKDLGNISIEKSTNPGYIDYMQSMMAQMHGTDPELEWDQSNWVELDFGSVSVERAEEIYNTYVGHTIKAGTIKGTYADNVNHRIVVSEDPETDGDLTYAPNYYCPVNFMGQTEVSANNKNFYFLNPKAQEYALATMAVWMGDNRFAVPAKEQGVNGADLSGAFYVNWDLNVMTEEAITPNLSTSEAYEFHAILRRGTSQSSSNAPRRAKSVTGKDVTPNAKYLVYPIDLIATETQVITAVTDVRTQNETTGDGYYYTITGQRVTNPTPGFYIRNGKKVIVR